MSVDFTAEDLGKDPDESTEEFNERKRQQLRGALEEEVTLDEDQEAALEALRAGRETAAVPIETVTIADTEITVRASISGEMETLMERMGDHDISFSERKDAMIDVILAFIVDDDESGPVDFTERAVWEAFYAEEGTEGLSDYLDVLSAPAYDRLERMQKFHGE